MNRLLHLLFLFLLGYFLWSIYPKTETKKRAHKLMTYLTLYGWLSGKEGRSLEETLKPIDDLPL